MLPTVRTVLYAANHEKQADQARPTTSYALLALLDQLGEATSYDIKQALDKSIENFWPVPHTTAYEEPARLAEGGYLSVEQEYGGRRRKSYSLTDEGRRALREWAGRADRGAAAAARRIHAQGLRRCRSRAAGRGSASPGTGPSSRSSAATSRTCARPRAGRRPSEPCRRPRLPPDDDRDDRRAARRR